MKLYRTNQGIIIEASEKFYLSNATNWDVYINQDNLFDLINTDIQSLAEISWNQEGILAPIENQEIWASGVTYMRSREARMDESKDSGGADFYAKVYEAERPNYFSNQLPLVVLVLVRKYASVKIQNGMFQSQN
jgi:2-dehydro-3-deoxy-D-arabinonate dehydratase